MGVVGYHKSMHSTLRAHLSNTMNDGAPIKDANYYGYKKYGEDCTYFVETGSHYGNGIAKALLLGFKKVVSCELNGPRYAHCVERFKDFPVELYERSSTEALKKIVPTLNKKTLFRLDAHGEGGGLPALEEIDIIGGHCNTHTIMIDDISPQGFLDGEVLKSKLLEINPSYTIERWQNRWEPPSTQATFKGCTDPEGAILVAFSPIVRTKSK